MKKLIKKVNPKIRYGLIGLFTLTNLLLVYKIVQNKNTLDYYQRTIKAIQSVELKQISLNGVDLPIIIPKKDTNISEVCYLAVSDVMCSGCVESAINVVNGLEKTKNIVVLYISPNPRLGKHIQNNYERVSVLNIMQKSYFLEDPTFFKLKDDGTMINVFIHLKGMDYRTNQYLEEVSK